MEALVEEDKPKESTTTAKASAKEAEDTTRLSECLRWRRRRCIYRLRELKTTTVVSVDEDGPYDSATTTEGSAEDKE